MGVKFTCQLSTDDDAWYGEDGKIADYSTQVADHLRKVVRRVANGETGGNVMDDNGNKIGSWKLR